VWWAKVASLVHDDELEPVYAIGQSAGVEGSQDAIGDGLIVKLTVTSP